MNKYLSDQEIEFYQEQGAIAVKSLFKPWIDLLRLGFEKVLKDFLKITVIGKE